MEYDTHLSKSRGWLQSPWSWCWALNGFGAQEQDYTWDLNTHSCHGTCSLEGMIKAENSGVARGSAFLPWINSPKQLPPEAAPLHVGDGHLKHWVHIPPPHSPKDGHSWAPTTQQVAETMHSCISATEEPVLTSGPSLCLRWGSKGRWSQFWCVLDVIDLCPTPLSLAVFLSPFMLHTNPRSV